MKYLKKLTDSYKYNDSKNVARIFMILHVLVLLTAVRCILTRNFESFAICILVLILFLAPAFFEDK